MKATTLIKRLERETKRETCKGSHHIGKTAKQYQFVASLADGAKLIRPCYLSGGEWKAKNSDYTKETETLLQIVGIKYESGNDAPEVANVATLLRYSPQ